MWFVVVVMTWLVVKCPYLVTRACNHQIEIISRPARFTQKFPGQLGPQKKTLSIKKISKKKRKHTVLQQYELCVKVCVRFQVVLNSLASHGSPLKIRSHRYIIALDLDLYLVCYYGQPKVSESEPQLSNCDTFKKPENVL